MPRLPMDPNCMELLFLWVDRSRVEIDDGWCSVGNIDYDALDDLRDDSPHLFKNEGVLVPENGWDEITQEFTEYESRKTTDIR
jgi:hypothetical protein